MRTGKGLFARVRAKMVKELTKVSPNMAADIALTVFLVLADQKSSNLVALVLGWFHKEEQVIADRWHLICKAKELRPKILARDDGHL